VSSLAQALSSVRHRPLRAVLTALGTGLGIATIVALLAVADGARQTARQLINLGPADFGLFQKDAADPTTSVLPESLVPRLDRLPAVQAVDPMQLLVDAVHSSPGAILFGIQSNGFLAGRLVITGGRMFSAPDEVVLGDTLAAQIHAQVGSVLKVGGRKLDVVGIDHVGIAFQDDGGFLPLSTAQAIDGDPDEATTLVAEAKATATRALAEREVSKSFQNLEVISDSQEATRAGANTQLIAKVTFVIAVLALIIGGIGVANTMLMSVLERRSEFALLSAVGWNGGRIAGLVMWEGVIVSMLGACIGLLVGTVGAQLLVNVLGASGLVSPDITAWGLGRGLLVGLLTGVLGGLYPAWRAAHVSPAQVLAQR
jgi:putative ABC transport system permease protein